ncbi:MAG: hypothetical protein AAGJ52_11850, partial [Pseudomonadota bacterium]
MATLNAQRAAIPSILLALLFATSAPLVFASGSESASTQSSEALETAERDNDDENAASLDRMVVTGRAQKLYRVTSTSSTRLPTEPLESPTTVVVINEELIRDQGARDAQDIYRNLSGVSL